MGLLEHFLATAAATLLDILPIVIVLVGFQVLVIRRKLPNMRKVIIGFAYVLIGLTLFLVGLREVLFPIGETMAQQLTAPEFIGRSGIGAAVYWGDYYWVYAFAAAIGFSATIAEPALIAVGMKAQRISGGTISAWGLRIAVAVGVAAGVSLGAFRIVTGGTLAYYIIAAYGVVVIQTVFAPRLIIPLAYDSGGVTTSTVTVPVVVALGLGLSSTIPGRSQLLDGFGLIAFACVFPIMSVLGFAMLSSWLKGRKSSENEEN